MASKKEGVLELKNLIDSVESISNQRRLDQEVVYQAIEDALAMAYRRSDFDAEYRVSIDRNTGDHEVVRCWEVLSDNDYQARVHADKVSGAKGADATAGGYINVSLAKDIDASFDIGDVMEEPAEADLIGRIAAQQVKQFILLKIREAERRLMADEYRERLNTMIMGEVKRVTREHLVLSIGESAEAILLRSQMIPRENFRVGDRPKVYLYDVTEDKRGPQLMVSRIAPGLLVELFKIEVPEIGEEMIQVMGASRDPGFRSKIAVKTNDGRIDPIGACVGMRGARVQAVCNELSGERVDIVHWNDNPGQFVIKAMQPAEVLSIVVDEEAKVMDVIVAEDQLSLAIGRNGQNVRLASELTGWELNVLTKDQYDEKSSQEVSAVSQLFVEQLFIDPVLADVLAKEGFRCLEELNDATDTELLAIEGIDEAVMESLRQTVMSAVLTQQLVAQEELLDAGPQEDLLNMEEMSPELAEALAAEGICSLDDLAEQSIDELQDILEISDEDASRLIMAARAHWFDEADSGESASSSDAARSAE